MKTEISLVGYEPAYIVGMQDELLRYIQSEYGIIVAMRNETIYLKGPSEKVRQARNFIQEVLKAYPKSFSFKVQPDDIEPATLDMVVTPKRKIHAKGPGQTEYLKSIDQCDIVISIGPAGTGKTYLGVAKAVSYLIEKKVERIILTRPAVEAGESLGFLPGAIEEKVDPYLRPLFDALNDFLPFDRIRKYLDMKVIEVAPLAYMRGRTLNDSFIILDEAQNTTGMQMKMFLTRMGWRSKVVVTGDITQIDLPTNVLSGLVEIQHLLGGIEGIQFVYLDKRDVVRHKLVQDIIRAYENKNSL